MFCNGSVLERLLTAREVARCLSISERTVWRWTALGVLPMPVHPRPRSTRWRALDIHRYLENLAPPTADGSGTGARACTGEAS
jgi:predicted DNA-binding transcriptional regulator AlpA